MSQSITNWESTLIDLRSKLVKGAEKLEFTVIYDDKKNTRQDLISAIIKIVICGRQLTDNLSKRDEEVKSLEEELATYKQEYFKKTSAITELGQEVCDLKDHMQESLESHTKTLSKEIKSYASVLKSETSTNINQSPVHIDTREIKNAVKDAVHDEMRTQNEPDRSSNLVFFGVEEPEDYECTVGVIESVMEDMGMNVNSEMIHVAERFSTVKNGKP